MNYVAAVKSIVLADVKVRLEQVVQGADVMALALRSNNTPGGEALARAVEAGDPLFLAPPTPTPDEAGVRADAERYRWLRDRTDARMDGGEMFASFDSWLPLTGTVSYRLDEDGCAPVDHKDLDAAIDQARAALLGETK